MRGGAGATPADGRTREDGGTTCENGAASPEDVDELASVVAELVRPVDAFGVCSARGARTGSTVGPAAAVADPRADTAGLTDVEGVAGVPARPMLPPEVGMDGEPPAPGAGFSFMRRNASRRLGRRRGMDRPRAGRPSGAKKVRALTEGVNEAWASGLLHAWLSG